jgi:hypothetical protein
MSFLRFGSPLCDGRLRPFVLASRVCTIGLIAGMPAAALHAADSLPQKNLVGAWSELASWPLNPIHMVLTRDGRVMSYGGTASGAATGYFSYDIWDPKDGLSGFHLTLPNGTATDIFCSAQLLLPQSGDILIAGGDNRSPAFTDNGIDASTIFKAKSNSLIAGRKMNRERWYATTTTLPNGETYIQGGDKGTDRPEIRGLDGSFRLLPGADTSSLSYYYPRNWVAPDGRIFGYANRSMYFVDWQGTGAIMQLGKMATSGPGWETSTEAMFAPGRILRVGGGGSESAASRNALTIDINTPLPKIQATERVPLGLHWATATIAADGKVIVTGGSAGKNKLSGVNSSALMWNPATGSWTVGANTSSGKARLYHSAAILLPDASVLVAGGGAPGPQTNLNAELYYPPYLFDAAGNLAPRPRIVSTWTSLKTGRDFTINVDNGASIARVTLVKTGSVTHSVNMDQRFLELSFVRSRNTLAVKAPKTNTIAPPGYYLLFVIDKQGVPSHGKIMPMYITPN